MLHSGKPDIHRYEQRGNPSCTCRKLRERCVWYYLLQDILRIDGAQSWECFSTYFHKLQPYSVLQHCVSSSQSADSAWQRFRRKLPTTNDTDDQRHRSQIPDLGSYRRSSDFLYDISLL